MELEHDADLGEELLQLKRGLAVVGVRAFHETPGRGLLDFGCFQAFFQVADVALKCFEFAGHGPGGGSGGHGGNSEGGRVSQQTVRNWVLGRADVPWKGSAETNQVGALGVADGNQETRTVFLEQEERQERKG